MQVLECVINVSEGRRLDVLDALAEAAGTSLVDRHADPHHHRAVLTLAGPEVEAAARAVATAAVAGIDLRAHDGAHPRLGVVDVVPFVPLAGSDMAAAVDARDAFAAWAGEALGLPCFFYGPPGGGEGGRWAGTGRTLPELRRGAFSTVGPDTGPPTPHPTAGACAVGARPVLVAYNLWLAPPADLDTARAVAARLRGPAVRALGLDLGGRPQVSCNLVDPTVVGPGAVFDAVAAHAPVERAELVGLVPAAVLAAEPPDRWAQLDLHPDRTIEARLARPGPWRRRPAGGAGRGGSNEAGLDGGRF